MLDKKEYISVNITSEGTVSTKQYLQHMPARSHSRKIVLKCKLFSILYNIVIYSPREVNQAYIFIVLIAVDICRT